MNTEWVEWNLGRLSDLLGLFLPLSAVREFEPTPDFYDRLFRAPDLNFAVRELCRHVGLETTPPVEVVGDKADGTITIACPDCRKSFNVATRLV